MSRKLFISSESGLEPAYAINSRLEKDIQNLIERNLLITLDAQLIASEFTTPDAKMRMDTLGLDKNNCPIVIEYKRDVSSSVINQGLFYLNWLANNKAEFKVLVQRVLGYKISEEVNWSGAKLICIASSFTQYDCEAVKQMNANIDLVAYQSFQHGILSLELIGFNRKPDYLSSIKNLQLSADKLSFSQKLGNAPQAVREGYELLAAKILSVSDDIVMRLDHDFVAVQCATAFSEDSTLARIRISDSDPMKIRTEIFASQEDYENTSAIRKKRTRNGFEFSVVDASSENLAAEMIRKSYVRSVLSY